MESYLEKNPNNARIFIDYRKDKDKVRFESVGKDSEFRIVLRTLLWFSFNTGAFLIPVALVCFIVGDSFSTNVLLRLLSLSLLALIFYTIFYVGGTLFIMKTRCMNYVPYMNTFGGRTFHIQIESKDIKNKMFEIPMFKNVMLTYKAYGDVGDNLERVEITEHPFNYMLLNRKGKKKKDLAQEYLWKTIFYFKEQPKDGRLEVYFK